MDRAILSERCIYRILKGSGIHLRVNSQNHREKLIWFLKYSSRIWAQQGLSKLEDCFKILILNFSIVLLSLFLGKQLIGSKKHPLFINHIYTFSCCKLTIYCCRIITECQASIITNGWREIPGSIECHSYKANLHCSVQMSTCTNKRTNSVNLPLVLSQNLKWLFVSRCSTCNALKY